MTMESAEAQQEIAVIETENQHITSAQIATLAQVMCHVNYHWCLTVQVVSRLKLFKFGWVCVFKVIFQKNMFPQQSKVNCFIICAVDAEEVQQFEKTSFKCHKCFWKISF